MASDTHDRASGTSSTSGPELSNPLAGRRGACDRCRGQKLRCLPSNQSHDPAQATCIRCFKARATCIYGMAKRAGRSPACNPSPPRKRRGNGGGEPAPDNMASKPATNGSGKRGSSESVASVWQDRHGNENRGRGRLLEEDTVDQESEGETTLIPSPLDDSSLDLSGIQLHFPACPSSSTTTLPLPEVTMPPFPNHDAEASWLETFGPEYSWVFQDHRLQPLDGQASIISQGSDHEQPGDVAVNAYGLHGQALSTNVQISGTSDEAMGLDLLNASAHTAPLNTNALDARPRLALPDSSGVSSIANPSLLKDPAKTKAGIKSWENSLSINESQHRRMQELSRLAMDLHAQLATKDPDPDTENQQQMSGGATTATFQNHLVGKVLKNSNTFLTLLSSFSKAATPSTPSLLSPSTPSTNHSNPASHLSDSNALPSAPALNIGDHATNEGVQHSYEGSDDSKPHAPIDMPTVLQLLTCYIHIVHLHSIMHAHIHDYLSNFLERNAEHVDSVPPVFPDMQVGGASLNKFGTFQVELLLRISVHVLGEIELALGLPREFRVGKSKDGRPGLLGASVSGDFVKCLLSEEACQGKVESVREQLGNLKRMLEDYN